LDGTDNKQNDYYNCYEGLEVPEHVKYKFMTKFPSKVLVWVAIIDRGFSKPYIHESKNAINTDIYIKKCIKLLNEFINKYHEDRNIVFWPDLASSHYANATLAELERLNIKVVPKSINPPNVPQLRPIETFWGNLKRNVYRNSFVAENTKKLNSKIKLKLKNMGTESVQNHMRGLKTKVRKAADRGVLSVIN
jgi:transposase